MCTRIYLLLIPFTFCTYTYVLRYLGIQHLGVRALPNRTSPVQGSHLVRQSVRAALVRAVTCRPFHEGLQGRGAIGASGIPGQSSGTLSGAASGTLQSARQLTRAGPSPAIGGRYGSVLLISAQRSDSPKTSPLPHCLYTVYIVSI